ncbi:hypothetical protein Clacol_005915 [Clathrus columnatus]|uniref:Uncharacterized protein n=1 Tax=Clathrus columnatus TaxID=1419009 RepID=A0AAV5AG63_9AGAM|nr:hypothetical protein Clacol_005915 [Clathrus columnatus]
MTTLLSQITTNPLVSGLTNAVTIQVQTSLETAVTIAETVYQSLGLHKTSALDVRHELATLSAAIEEGPKGVAIFAAISRTTASIKSLPGPVTQDEGIAILNSCKEVQVKISVLLSAVSVRVTSVEHGAPGLCEYGINRLLALFTVLTQALLNILPSSISADEVQGIHNGIESACNDTLTSVRNSVN